MGRIAPDQLFSLTKNALLGVSMEENLGLNYYYALPNKLFDYIQARIPVLVSDFPEMSRIVKDYNIGETIKSRESKEFAKQIMSMLQSPDREQWKQNLEKAAGELNWEKEKFKLLEVFDNISID
jgi:glycosyltransferase involved in cell wall biosynthesis